MANQNMVDKITQTMRASAELTLTQAEFLAEQGIDLGHDAGMRNLLDQLCAIFMPPKSNQSEEYELSSEQAAKERLFLFTELRDAVRNGTAQDKFPTGSVLPDVWTDILSQKTYVMPHIIVDYRIVRKPHCKEPQPAVVLMRKNALPAEDQYGTDNDFATSLIAAYLEGTYGKGCSAELLSVVKPLVLPESPKSKQTTFFLPSLEEITPGTESVWKYFQDTEWLRERNFKFANPNGETKTCWLRSTGHKPDDEAYGINGNAEPLSAFYNCLSCTPVCVIY